MASMKPWKARLFLLAIFLGFIGLGLLFIPRMGIEVDEALVAFPIYAPGTAAYSWHWGHHEIPLMLSTYVGALKSWFYYFLFSITPPRPISLRLPTLMLTASTLWIFFGILRDALDRRAAWIGVLLLATDTSYLMLTIPDFGPIVLQFFFKLSALALLLRFSRTGSRIHLVASFFLLGLGLWDKILFTWVLIGFAAGAIVAFPKELRPYATKTNIGIAGLAFLIGALPLLIYNIARPAETLRVNLRTEQVPVRVKLEILKRTVDGSGHAGFIPSMEPGPDPGDAHRWYQRLSISIAKWTGHPRHNLIFFPALAVLGFLPFLWPTPARKPLLFAITVCLGTWLAIVFTPNTGTATHHAILIWPFHLMAIAIVLARFPKMAAVATTALLCCSNLALTNQYYADLLINGPAIRWTDAMDPLARYLMDLHAPRVVAADWGFLETMTVLSKGGLSLYAPDDTNDASIRWALSDPANVFVAHSANFVFHPWERAAIENLAQRDGYQEIPLASIHDRNGRPTFDIFRFRKPEK